MIIVYACTPKTHELKLPHIQMRNIDTFISIFATLLKLIEFSVDCNNLTTKEINLVNVKNKVSVVGHLGVTLR